jgi:hypothetical protein
VYHQRSFPKTHDLAELLKIALLVDPLLEDIRANVRELLPYAVASVIRVKKRQEKNRAEQC